MSLTLKRFSKLEYERKYSLIEFKERGKPFAFLRRKSQQRINSGNKYKFGVIDKDGKYWWFFHGMSTCRDRQKAIDIYNALRKHCFENKIGRPFAYKE